MLTQNRLTTRSGPGIMTHNSMDPVLKQKSMKLSAYQSLLRLYPFQEGVCQWNQQRIRHTLQGFSHKKGKQSASSNPPRHAISPYFPEEIFSHNTSVTGILHRKTTMQSNVFTTTLKTKSKSVLGPRNGPAVSTEPEPPVRLPTLVSPAFTAVFNHVPHGHYSSSRFKTQSANFVVDLPDPEVAALTTRVPTADHNNIRFVKMSDRLSPTSGIIGSKMMASKKNNQYVMGTPYRPQWDDFLFAAPNTPDSVLGRRPLVRFQE